MHERFEIFAKKVSTFLNENKMTKAEFCRKCDISISSLNNILKANCGNLSFAIIIKIAKLFNCKAHELLYN